MIKHFQTDEELLQGYPVLKELRPHLTEESFLEINETMQREGYEVHALYEGEEVVAVTGIIILTNFYDGRHIYVYDLVTKGTSRSKGYGEMLLKYIEEMGKKEDARK